MMETPHEGSRWRYENWRHPEYGCRCEACTKAEADYIAARKRKRAAMPLPGHVPHGRATTYSNWGCRCEACLTAQREQNRVRAKGRRSESAPSRDNRPWTPEETEIACNVNLPLILRAELVGRTESAVIKRRQRALKQAGRG